MVIIHINQAFVTAMRYDLENLIDNLHDPLYMVDRDRKIIFWNRAAERMTGYPASEVVGRSCMDNILNHVDGEGRNLCESGCPLLWAISEGGAPAETIYLRHKSGHRLPVSVRVTPLLDENRQIVGAAEMFLDVSSTQALENKLKELAELALVDPFTRLANRAHLTSELERLFSERQRSGRGFGVLFMDVDNLGYINQLHGHDMGDAVLKMTARTLSFSGRPYDLFGRWGDDEFLGLILNVDHHSLAVVAERCRVLVEKSYIQLGEAFINATISLGGTVPVAHDSVETLLKRVDSLLYLGKGKGKNRLVLG